MFVQINEFTINLNLVRYVNRARSHVYVFFDAAGERLENNDYLEFEGDDAERFMRVFDEWSKLLVYKVA